MSDVNAERWIVYTGYDHRSSSMVWAHRIYTEQSDLLVIPACGSRETADHIANAHNEWLERQKMIVQLNLEGIPLVVKMQIDPADPSAGHPTTQRTVEDVRNADNGNSILEFLNDQAIQHLESQALREMDEAADESLAYRQAQAQGIDL